MFDRPRPASAYLSNPCPAHPLAPAPSGRCVLCEGEALARQDRRREAAKQRYEEKTGTVVNWAAKFGPKT